MFNFDADSGIAGTAFAATDSVVAAWGTLNAAGTRLQFHSGRVATATTFTWSAGASATPTLAFTGIHLAL